MSSAPTPNASRSKPPADHHLDARIALVEQHIRLENAHDLRGVLATFGDSARYDDEPWDDHHTGRDGVQHFYQQLMKALPDLQIDVQRRHVTSEAILVEVIIRGTHLGATVLRQLGVFHEPHSLLGQLSTLLTHPLTIARALTRNLLRG